MSWWVTDYIAVSEDETKQLCNIQADEVSDLPAQDQTATAGFIFVRGSKAEVLATSGKYIMNSSGQWILQKSGQEIEISAYDIVYDNTSSGMTATTVQDAIDELKDTDDTQDNALAELYGVDANQQLEINYAINTGAKNLCPYNQITATAAGTVINDQPINLSSGTYILSFDHTATTGSTAFRFLKDGVSVLTFTIYNSSAGKESRTFTIPSEANQIRIYSDVANTYTDIMIREDVIRNSTFEPYAPTNRELYETKTEQTETNVIANLGAKNLFPITATSQTIGGVTFTVNDDGTVTANGTKTNSGWFILSENNSLDANTYTLSDGLPDGSIDCRLVIAPELSISTAIMSTTADLRTQTKTFTTEQTGLYYAIRIASGVTVNNLIFKPMIRRAEITDPSFQPYAPSNRELYETKVSKEDVFGLGTALTTGLDLNSITGIGVYYAPSTTIAQSLLNCPASYTFRLEIKTTNGTNRYMQTIYEVSTTNGQIAIYRRAYTVNGWQSWYKFEGTQVATVQSVNSLSTLNLSRNDLNESLDSNFDLIDSIPEEEEGELE